MESHITNQQVVNDYDENSNTLYFGRDSKTYQQVYKTYQNQKCQYLRTKSIDYDEDIIIMIYNKHLIQITNLGEYEIATTTIDKFDSITEFDQLFEELLEQIKINP